MAKREITYRNIEQEDKLVQGLFSDAVVAKADAKVAEAAAKAYGDTAKELMKAVLSMIGDDKRTDIGYEEEGVGQIRWGIRNTPYLDQAALAEILVADYEMKPDDVGEAIQKATKNRRAQFPEFRPEKERAG